MFRSFFLGGFECATGINRHGAWFDQIEATQHDLQVAADYRGLTGLGIHTLREGIRWPLVDRGGGYDFSTVTPFLAAARQEGVEVIWDLFHYGYPSACDPLSPCFVERFSAYCAAVTRHVCDHSDGPWYFTPMNEPSYFSWAAGEVGRFAPHLQGRGRELKIALVRAAIQGIDAIRRVCPHARMVNVDPICRAVPPIGRDEMTAGAWHFNHLAVYEGWDMLSGRLMPELGGTRRHLDIVGINYYWNNQWEIGREEVALADLDPRRMALRNLVADVWDRYGGEVVISETSHVGSGRGAWVDCITEEVVALQERGIPLAGVCWYPVLGMPEWHERDQWAHMGLWDLRRQGGRLMREPCVPMIAALHRSQMRLGLPTGGTVIRSLS